MATYYPTIGLEIHAELATETKMFCACKNDADEMRPNVNICPVCMGHPGTLPVPNQKAIESVVKVGLAVNGDIANFSEFDRKNYFYPDIPKGYQISQYKYPIVSNGEIAGVKLTRIHLEEDTANSKHDRGNFSLVDFNRAGVPLMELVTEPVMHDADTAMKFGKELQLLLKTLGVSHANMEKGEMRVELNISISPDQNTLGTKVEVKNINSFSAVGKAAAYEIARMSALYEAGRESEIVQETRGWDETKQVTYSQRKKESSHDYRYFPDPDIPKFYLHEMFDLEKMKSELPELPWQKRERLIKDFGLTEEQSEIFMQDFQLAEYFEQVAKILKNEKQIKLASNYIANDLRDSFKSTPIQLTGEVVTMVDEGHLSSRGAKDIFIAIAKGTKMESVKDYATEKGLIQQNDEGTLKLLAQKYIDTNPNVVAEYKAGKQAAIMFFVGQIMKETKGSANPEMVQKILKELLG